MTQEKLTSKQKIRKSNNKFQSGYTRKKWDLGIDLLIIIIAILIAFSLSFWLDPSLFFPYDEEIHDAIYRIESDDDFKKYPSISGSGKVDDPYLLKNVKFITQKSYLQISDTQAHFRIRDCTFRGAPRITIIRSSNILITNNRFEGGNDGISYLTSAPIFNISIINNVFDDYGYAIKLGSTYNCNIINNSINNCNRAIELRIPPFNIDQKNYITGNDFVDCYVGIDIEGGESIYSEDPENVFIEDNSGYNLSLIKLENIDHVKMHNNKFEKLNRISLRKVEFFDCTDNIFDIGKKPEPPYFKIIFESCNNVFFDSNIIFSEKECLEINREGFSFNITNNEFIGLVGLNFTLFNRSSLRKF